MKITHVQRKETKGNGGKKNSRPVQRNETKMWTDDHNQSPNEADEKIKITYRKRIHADGCMRQKRKIVSKANKMFKSDSEVWGVRQYLWPLIAYRLQCLNVWHHECLTVAKLVVFPIHIFSTVSIVFFSLSFSIVSNCNT